MRLFLWLWLLSGVVLAQPLSVDGVHLEMSPDEVLKVWGPPQEIHWQSPVRLLWIQAGRPLRGALVRDGRPVMLLGQQLEQGERVLFRAGEDLQALPAPATIVPGVGVRLGDEQLVPVGAWAVDGIRLGLTRAEVASLRSDSKPTVDWSPAGFVRGVEGTLAMPALDVVPGGGVLLRLYQLGPCNDPEAPRNGWWRPVPNLHLLMQDWNVVRCLLKIDDEKLLEAVERASAPSP